MQLFACPTCGSRLFFDNTTCACGAEVALDPETMVFGLAERPCANRALIQCNWKGEDADGHCRSCRMTEVRPDPSVQEAIDLWAVSESAKRWVLANLGRWGWFTDTDHSKRPIFHMLAEETRTGDTPVIMGHDDGLVTINVNEADPAKRMKRREDLGESLRTMNGHFRHEIAHYFFVILCKRDGFLDEFHRLFGDEEADYSEALEAYYENSAPEDWRDRFISPYSTAHPHEDWAESFAHLLHLTDIVDSFVASGLTGTDLPAADYDAYQEGNIDALIGYGGRLGIALNHVNRSMGLSDLYPFTHTPAIIEKFACIHDWMCQGPPQG